MKPMKINEIQWFQQEIDRLRDENRRLVEELSSQIPNNNQQTFQSMGHIRTNKDCCDFCGLNGRAFEVSVRKGWAICCPIGKENVI